MKVGDSVRVRQGILDPDTNKFDMSGWQGRIRDITRQSGSSSIEVAWDSITLNHLPKAFVENSIEEGYDYSTMFLGMEDLELTEPRDKESDIEKALEKIEGQYHHSAYDEQEKRIATILATDDLMVTDENQRKYFDFLKKNIQDNILLTGAEDFSWEEKYLFGGWSKKEYEELKKTRPSYTDKFEFIELMEDIDEAYGVMAKVKRVKDKKLFELPLWDLKCIDQNSKSDEYISDYSFWMTNYR